MSIYDQAIKDNDKEMRYLFTRIEGDINAIREAMEKGEWNEFAASHWVKGFTARDITHFTSLLAMRNILEQAKKLEEKI